MQDFGSAWYKGDARAFGDVTLAASQSISVILPIIKPLAGLLLA